MLAVYTYSWKLCASIVADAVVILVIVARDTYNLLYDILF